MDENGRDEKARGYAPVPRGIRNHPSWRKEPFTKGQALVDLFLGVTHTKCKKDGVWLTRGQDLIKKRVKAKLWKWSREKTENFFRSLERDRGELWAIEQEIMKTSAENPKEKPRAIGVRITFIYYDLICGKEKK